MISDHLTYAKGLPLDAIIKLEEEDREEVFNIVIDGQLFTQ
jgi:hypothetical protein